MKKILLTLLILCSITITYAQKGGTINGKIVDTENQDLPGITIRLLNTSFSTSTNSTGDFSFKNVPNGNYTIEASGVGFSAQKQNVIVSGKPLNISLQLNYTTNTLQEVVVLGKKLIDHSSVLTRTTTPLQDIPQSIQSIGRTTIEQQQIYTVDEAMKNVAGVNPSSSGTYNFRGYTTSTRNFLVNGQNGNPYPEGVAPLLANIERVEVIHGASSIFYGSGAIGGNINLITKQPKKDFTVRGSAGLGSFNLYRVLSDVTGSINKSKSLYYIAGLGYQNGGRFTNDYKNRNLQLYGSLKWEINKKTNWLVNLNYSNDRNSSNVLAEVPIFDGQLYSVSNKFNYLSEDAFYKGNNFQVQSSLEHKFGANWTGNLLLNYARGSSDRKQYDLLSFADGQTQAVERYITIQKINYPSLVIDPYVNGTFTVAGIKNQIVAGMNVTINRSYYPNGILQFSATTLNIENPDRSPFDRSTAIPYLFSSEEKFTNNTVGGYIQNQIELSQRVKILAGLRYNNYFRRYRADSISYDLQNYQTEPFIELPERNEAFIPRVGLVYQPFKTTSFYADYNRGFIPQYGNYTTTGGPFKPETSNQFEFGFKGEFFNKTFMPTFAIYQNTKKNVLTPATLSRDRNDPLFGLLRTLGEVQSKGYEIGITGNFIKNLSVIANYSYNDVKITESNRPTEINQRFNNSPKNIANFWLAYDNAFTKGLQLGFGSRYTSKRFFENKAETEDVLVLPEYFVTDAFIGYSLNKYTIQLNGNNIFNRNYAQGSAGSYAYIPGTPRNFLLTLRFDLK